MLTARSLQRLFVLLIAVLVLGAFGGWAASLAGGDALYFSITWLSFIGSSVILALLGRAIDRACGVTKGGWVLMAIGACVPFVRIFVELSMGTRMARTVAAAVDDDAVLRRARRLLLVRAAVNLGQHALPFALFATVGPGGPVWLWAIGIATVASFVLLVVAVHVVVSALADKLTHAAPVALGGAGGDAPVAVSTTPTRRP